MITCLFSGKPEPEEKLRDAEHFEQLSGAPIQSNPLIARPGKMLLPQILLSKLKKTVSVAARQQVLAGTNYIAVAAAIACIFALMMPTEGDKNSQLPLYLHLSVNMKMVFTYVLGMFSWYVISITCSSLISSSRLGYNGHPAPFLRWQSHQDISINIFICQK